MAASNFEDLMNHVGHDLECVTYGDVDNVAVECIDCGCVIIDYDKENTNA